MVLNWFHSGVNKELKPNVAWQSLYVLAFKMKFSWLHRIGSLPPTVLVHTRVFIKLSFGWLDPREFQDTLDMFLPLPVLWQGCWAPPALLACHLVCHLVLSLTWRMLLLTASVVLSLTLNYPIANSLKQININYFKISKTNKPNISNIWLKTLDLNDDFFPSGPSI